jgi:hypothetical protein
MKRERERERETQMMQRYKDLTRGVSHNKGCGFAIYIKKYLKAKRRIMETQIFHHAKKY